MKLKTGHAEPPLVLIPRRLSKTPPLVLIPRGLSKTLSPIWVSGSNRPFGQHFPRTAIVIASREMAKTSTILVIGCIFCTQRVYIYNHGEQHRPHMDFHRLYIPSSSGPESNSMIDAQQRAVGGW